MDLSYVYSRIITYKHYCAYKLLSPIKEHLLKDAVEWC
jgi:hypothetical protein